MYFIFNNIYRNILQIQLFNCLFSFNDTISIFFAY